MTLQLMSPLPPDHLQETWSRVNGSTDRYDGSVNTHDDQSQDDRKHSAVEVDIQYKQKVDHKYDVNNNL